MVEQSGKLSKKAYRDCIAASHEFVGTGDVEPPMDYS